MNLQEQINRTKELMGLQPLNEGIFKKKGKLKDFIKKLFKKGGNGEQIAQEINPYEDKYGKENSGCFVDGQNFMIVSNKQKGDEVKSLDVFCSIFVITDNPTPLPSDNTKESTNISYGVIFQKKEGNDIKVFYDYFKSVYVIDGQVTDEVSQLRELGGNFTCSTSTLENNGSGCSLPEDVKEIILKAFENNKNYSSVQSQLDKIK